MTHAPLENRMTIVTPEGVRLELAIAGIGSRLAARLLDSLIQGAFILALILTLGATGVMTNGFGGSGGVVVAIVILILFFTLFLYDLVFEIAMNGQTPGKRATGIRVVDASGAPAAPLALVTRNIVRIVDFLPVYYAAGLITMLATQRTQRLGDLAAHTIVVRERTGDQHNHALHAFGTQLSVPPSAIAAWDVSAVTPDEVQLCRQFLMRRFTVPPHVRYELSLDIAQRLARKITGLPPTSHPEFVIEGIVLAKDLRA